MWDDTTDPDEADDRNVGDIRAADAADPPIQSPVHNVGVGKNMGVATSPDGSMDTTGGDVDGVSPPPLKTTVKPQPAGSAPPWKPVDQCVPEPGH